MIGELRISHQVFHHLPEGQDGFVLFNGNEIVVVSRRELTHGQVLMAASKAITERDKKIQETHAQRS